MIIDQTTKYLNFITYCNKRRLFSRHYKQAKQQFFTGSLSDKDYFKTIKKIHQSAIELELEYFDVLHMRL